MTNHTLTVGAPVTYIGDDPLEHARPGDTGEVVGWPPLRDRFVVQFAEGREILWPGELEAVTAAQQLVTLLREQHPTWATVAKGGAVVSWDPFVLDIAIRAEVG